MTIKQPAVPIFAREGFSKEQLRKLARGVDRTRIRVREVEGKTLSYIEGWYAIAQANAIFGYAGWDREMVHFERVAERVGRDTALCGYIARVRVRVRAGATEVLREGSGWGWASARTSAIAHERALKAAETDATKRALSTFGPRFGLSFYDRDQAGSALHPQLTLYAPDGSILAEDLSPEGFSTGLRQLIELCIDAEQIDRLAGKNSKSISRLRVIAPRLRNSHGTHFADLLLKLVAQAREHLAVAPRSSNGAAGDNHSRQQEGEICADVKEVQTDPSASLPEPSPGSEPRETDHSADLADGRQGGTDSSSVSSPAAIDKSQLAIGTERRLRDKEHLRRVAELPCLVCSRQPSHAHHLRFAQRRGMSQKVSDEYVVPLCALHHGDLHRSSSEQDWWKRQNIDPLSVAAELWDSSRGEELRCRLRLGDCSERP